MTLHMTHKHMTPEANENREGGNKMVASGQHEQAIGRYSEAARADSSHTMIKQMVEQFS